MEVKLVAWISNVHKRCSASFFLLLLLLFFFLEFFWTSTKHLAGMDGDEREMDLKEPHSLPPEQGGLRKLGLKKYKLLFV